MDWYVPFGTNGGALGCERRDLCPTLVTTKAPSVSVTTTVEQPTGWGLRGSFRVLICEMQSCPCSPPSGETPNGVSRAEVTAQLAAPGVAVLFWFLEPDPSARWEERKRGPACLGAGGSGKSHLRMQRAWLHLPRQPGFPQLSGGVMQSASLLLQPEGCVRLGGGACLSHKEIAGCLRKALGLRGKKEQIRTWACPPRPLHPGSQPRGRLGQRALDWKPRKRRLPSSPHPHCQSCGPQRPGSQSWVSPYHLGQGGFYEPVSSSVLGMAVLTCMLNPGQLSPHWS